MLAANRTRPPKPYSEYPLFAHACGQWVKKVGGQLRYFGKWSDPAAALTKWLAQKDALLAGREPLPVGPNDITLKELCNDFLTSKKALVESGEITQRTWDEYLETARRLARVLGAETAVTHLVTQDFERLRKTFQKTWGPVRVGNEIQRVRCLFKHGLDSKLLSESPTYGQGFKKPSRKTLRRHRNRRGRRMFEAAELRQILEAAGPTLKAMTLLAINCGFGNNDVATIGRKHVDLRGKWVSYPRPKTEVRRRCPLWPETVRAVKAVLRRRRGLGDRGLGLGTEGNTTPGTPPAPNPQPPTPSRKYRRLLFLTRHGGPWWAKSRSPISEEFRRLLQRLGLWQRGLCFYGIRHTFETIGGDTKDQVAVDAIMGHAEEADDMAAVYRETIKDERLRAVTDHVHAWLWPDSQEQAAPSRRTP